VLVVERPVNFYFGNQFCSVSVLFQGVLGYDFDCVNFLSVYVCKFIATSEASLSQELSSLVFADLNNPRGIEVFFLDDDFL
jgi:hypothetical protein